MACVYYLEGWWIKSCILQKEQAHYRHTQKDQGHILALSGVWHTWNVGYFEETEE